MANLPQKPERPAAMNKRYSQLTETEHDEMRVYFDAMKEWESKIAPKGRAYNPGYIGDLIGKAQNVLLDWLEANGAPDEIYTIAAWLVKLQFIRTGYTRYDQGKGLYWRDEMSNRLAADIAEGALAVKRAINNLRKQGGTTHK